MLGVGVGATAGAVWLMRLVPAISSTTVALVLLLVVLGTATFGKRRAAIAVAVVATLAFNYFFFAPVGTFTIADPPNLVALLAFLAVAIIASNLSALAQVRAREAVREREAAELDRQRADLASTLLTSLSHDLRTPLTAVRVAVANLEGDLLPGERAAQAAVAAAELERLTRLFEDILAMARIDAAAVDVDRQWVTAADVVDAAAAHVRPILSRRHVDLRAAADRVVQIDPRATSVALSYLLENAAKYSPADRDIVVEATVDDGGLRISVTDGGPGLEADEIDRVFDRFFRGRAARRSGPGSGMGLAISRGLLAAIGGQVWAENGPGGGARFTIAVPGPSRPAAVAEAKA